MSMISLIISSQKMDQKLMKAIARPCLLGFSHLCINHSYCPTLILKQGRKWTKICLTTFNAFVSCSSWTANILTLQMKLCIVIASCSLMSNMKYVRINPGQTCVKTLLFYDAYKVTNQRDNQGILSNIYGHSVQKC